jgi:hypothetical protein
MPPYGKYKSFSYRFDTLDRSFLFTGDTGWSDAVIDLAKGADVLVTEVTDTDDVIGLMKSRERVCFAKNRSPRRKWPCGQPNNHSAAALKGFFVCALCMVLFETSPLSAQWWNLFAPKDYEDCAESAARDAKSKAALDIFLEACDSKFKGRRKLGGGYTYFDPRQFRDFDIAGPNPTKREVETIDRRPSE